LFGKTLHAAEEPQEVVPASASSASHMALDVLLRRLRNPAVEFSRQAPRRLEKHRDIIEERTAAADDLQLPSRKFQIPTKKFQTNSEYSVNFQFFALDVVWILEFGAWNFEVESSSMKIALIADWLTVFGGAEHAIEQFLGIWPEAPLYTTVAGQNRLGPLARARIMTTALQRRYQLIGRHQWLLSAMPEAIENIDLSGFDAILSSSHAVAKGIIPPQNATHVCYCHTPLRYAWEMEEQYLDDFRIPRLLRPSIKKRLADLRRWDLSTAKRVDTFIANSTETKRRIETIYGRESIVVTPPVDDRFFSVPLTNQSERKTYLAVGRLVPYKRFDLLIQVANELKLPLLIAGTGQEEARLRRVAGPTVTFAGFVADEDLPSLYAKAKAVLFPPHEDAGIVPLEAQACGTPVIAYGKGGALDSIKAGETGMFFDDQTSESLQAAIENFSKRIFDPETVRNHARQFSSAHFREKVRGIVEDAVAQYCPMAKGAAAL
jgi:glycosyltransferase involved in cell wall biosynthesis